MSTDRPLELHLALPEPYVVEVVRCRLDEGMSQRTEANVEIATNELLDVAALVGEAVTLRLDGRETRQWPLVLAEARFTGEEGGRLRYEIICFDPLWPQSLTKSTRKFRGASARDIVGGYLDRAGVAHRWRLTAEPPRRRYCVQYRESNLAFIERLLEFEGIYYRYDDEGVLELGDHSVAATPTLAQDAPFELLESEGALSRGEEGLSALRRRGRLLPGKVTLMDYNWKHPELTLRASAVGDRDADLELYQPWSGYRQPDEGSRLARLRLEAERAMARVLEGSGSIVTFAPGHRFAVGDAAAGFGGRYLLVKVEHVFHHGGFDGLETSSYENSFKAIPETVPFRPPLVTPVPVIRGTHSAMVRGPVGEEIYTDEYGRFRVQHHWDREARGDDHDSRWLRLLQEPTTSQHLARVGWEMFVVYVEGDPDRPFGLGRAINGTALPSYALPGNMSRMTMQTPSSPASGGFSELMMDDAAGRQGINFRAEKDLDILVKNDRFEWIGNNETHTVGESLDHTVFGAQQVEIGQHESSTYGKDHMLQVQGNRTVTVGVNEQVTVKLNQSAKVALTDSETVGAMRLTTSGSFELPDIGELAKSAALTFVRKASPGGASLEKKYKKTKSAVEAGVAVVEDPYGYVEGYVEGQAEGLTERGEEHLTSAGNSAFETFGRTGSLSKSANTFDEKLNEGAEEEAKGIEGSVQGLKDMIPTQRDFRATLDGLDKDFDTLVPTTDTLKGALTDGANTLTGGLYGSLKKGDYRLALEQALDMFVVGGIKRSAPTASLKIVGGCYVQTCFQEISWTIGKAYFETVGGAKLTATPESISQSVKAPLALTVGGAVLRASGEEMKISAVKSAIRSGAVGDVSSPARIEVKGADVVVEALVGLALTGGDAAIDMTPASMEIAADLSVDGSDVAISASLADLK